MQKDIIYKINTLVLCTNKCLLSKCDRRHLFLKPICFIIKGTNEKSMNGVLTVMVREAKKLTTNLLIAQIALSIICIPLSIIHSFSFAFILVDPKSGGTEKGMTVPQQL